MFALVMTGVSLTFFAVLGSIALFYFRRWNRRAHHATVVAFRHQGEAFLANSAPSSTIKMDLRALSGSWVADLSSKGRNRVYRYELMFTEGIVQGTGAGQDGRFAVEGGHSQGGGRLYMIHRYETGEALSLHGEVALDCLRRFTWRGYFCTNKNSTGTVRLCPSADNFGSIKALSALAGASPFDENPLDGEEMATLPRSGWSRPESPSGVRSPGGVNFFRSSAQMSPGSTASSSPKTCITCDPRSCMRCSVGVVVCGVDVAGQPILLCIIPCVVHCFRVVVCAVSTSGQAL